MINLKTTFFSPSLKDLRQAKIFCLILLPLAITFANIHVQAQKVNHLPLCKRFVSQLSFAGLKLGMTGEEIKQALPEVEADENIKPNSYAGKSGITAAYAWEKENFLKTNSQGKLSNSKLNNIEKIILRLYKNKLYYFDIQYNVSPWKSENDSAKFVRKTFQLPSKAKVFDRNKFANYKCSEINLTASFMNDAAGLEVEDPKAAREIHLRRKKLGLPTNVFDVLEDSRE